MDENEPINDRKQNTIAGKRFGKGFTVEARRLLLVSFGLFVVRVLLISSVVIRKLLCRVIRVLGIGPVICRSHECRVIRVHSIRPFIPEGLFLESFRSLGTHFLFRCNINTQWLFDRQSYNILSKNRPMARIMGVQ